jgi:GH15 family glucan-1,4-alpha-glucosidase
MAHRMLGWIEGAATAEGYLPEQVQDQGQSPCMQRYSRHTWGPAATPLVWSHATHIVLANELARDEPSQTRSSLSLQQQ